MPDIFKKIRLQPGQLRTVADRRFDDAMALSKTRKNKHANGAMYLGGFVFECLLKAKLMERYSWLQSAGTAEGRSSKDSRIWSLCYRSHDLGELLAKLPEIQSRLGELGQRESQRLRQMLAVICSEWTIYARYSPRTATIGEADLFLERVRELKQWLM